MSRERYVTNLDGPSLVVVLLREQLVKEEQLISLRGMSCVLFVLDEFHFLFQKVYEAT